MPKYKYDMKGRVLSVGEVKKLVKAQSRPWMRSLIGFLYLFGARVSEVLDVRVGDFMIDREDEMVGVTIRVGKKKTAKGPNKKMPHVVWAKLDAPFMPLILDRLQVKSRGGFPRTRLWPYTRQAVWYHINKVDPELSPHAFRHSRLMHLANQGASLWEIRDFAGWEDASPAEYYIKTSTERLKGMADKIK